MFRTAATIAVLTAMPQLACAFRLEISQPPPPSPPLTPHPAPPLPSPPSPPLPSPQPHPNPYPHSHPHRHPHLNFRSPSPPPHQIPPPSTKITTNTANTTNNTNVILGISMNTIDSKHRATITNTNTTKNIKKKTARERGQGGARARGGGVLISRMTAIARLRGGRRSYMTTALSFDPVTAARTPPVKAYLAQANNSPPVYQGVNLPGT